MELSLTEDELDIASWSTVNSLNATETAEYAGRVI